MMANPEAKPAADGGKSNWEKLAGGIDLNPFGTIMGAKPTTVGDTADSLTGGLVGIWHAVKVLPAAAAWMVQPHNWLRVVEVLMGAALVLAGMWHLSPATVAPIKAAAGKAAALVAVA